jgi:16S rRNA (uracil1498-N3)-methyltransferase
MEWAIEKCTELNVSRIVPVIASRTEKHLALAAEKRVERWRRIAREAAEQSRRTGPPEIADPVKLNEAVTSIGAEVRLVLDESEHDATLVELLHGGRDVSSLALAVGPEGGWTREELQSFGGSQWLAASLGDTILRAETAAIAAVAVARSSLDP